MKKDKILKGISINRKKFRKGKKNSEIKIVKNIKIVKRPYLTIRISIGCFWVI